MNNQEDNRRIRIVYLVLLVSTFPKSHFIKIYQCSDELTEERIVKVLEFESEIHIEIV